MPRKAAEIKINKKMKGEKRTTHRLSPCTAKAAKMQNF
jgi:hypothetical protein